MTTIETELCSYCDGVEGSYYCLECEGRGVTGHSLQRGDHHLGTLWSKDVGRSEVEDLVKAIEHLDDEAAIEAVETFGATGELPGDDERSEVEALEEVQEQIASALCTVQAACLYKHGWQIQERKNQAIQHLAYLDQWLGDQVASLKAQQAVVA